MAQVPTTLSTIDELRTRIYATVPEIGTLVYGVSASRAYAMAEAGEMPGVVRHGRRLRVNVARFIAAIEREAIDASDAR